MHDVIFRQDVRGELMNVGHLKVYSYSFFVCNDNGQGNMTDQDTGRRGTRRQKEPSGADTSSTSAVLGSMSAGPDFWTTEIELPSSVPASGSGSGVTTRNLAVIFVLTAAFSPAVSLPL